MNYLRCVLDETMSSEIMALRVIKKINSRLEFLYRKNRFLDVPFRKSLCNGFSLTLIMSVLHGTQIWQRNLKRSCKLHKTYVRFCSKLQCMEHTRNEHFEKMNWLQINQKFKECVISTVFTLVQNKCPAYMNEVYRPAENIRVNTRNSYLKLPHSFR